VFDLIGGETQRRSWGVLNPGGTLVSTLGEPPQEEARKYTARAVGYMAQPSAGQLTEIAALIDQGAVRPIVQAKYTLEQIRSAQQRVENTHTVGKIVIDVVPSPVAA
jgi:NADPH:quinone reductase-like Zn-dependent oxidoreductase